MLASGPGAPPIISTNRARCRDCYRCVRVCPVKAIRMRDGQAEVLEERCIFCGTCVRECPQKAKTVRDDTAHAQELLSRGKRVAASVAPSFAASFAPHEIKRFATALRRLGFAYVGETSLGAQLVAELTAGWVVGAQTSLVTSACPAVVRYVERYAPESVSRLVPVMSPMLAHAKLLRDRASADAVVFIGPCIAKKFEAQRPENHGLVDCVLTFQELRAWLQREGIAFELLEESRFDEESGSRARLFPLVGGQLHAGRLPTDLLDATVCPTAGVEQLREALDLSTESPPLVFEALFCPSGCIAGPGMTTKDNLVQRRLNLLRYAQTASKDVTDINQEPAACLPVEAFQTTFSPQPLPGQKINESALRQALVRIGKVDPRDRLDCGACGYPSCLDKARAVALGLAEPEMCMPYMRYLAERRTDRIIETSPNGIVILDKDLHILSMNPAFCQIYLCSQSTLGRHISYITDPAPFEAVATDPSRKIERTVRDPAYGRVFHQIVYAMPDEQQLVGIFVDITAHTLTRERLAVLHREATTKSRQLLEHQVRMAQDITRMLAQYTARGEDLVKSILETALLVPSENEVTSQEQ